MNKHIKQKNNSLLNSHNELIIQHCEITPYKIKLIRPLYTASSCLYFREGFLVRITTNNASSATGECAPMTEIGTESLQQAQQFLEKKLAAIIGQPLSEELLSDMSDFPACRFALEYTFLSLIAQQNNTSITHLLNPQFTSKIKVNAMLGTLNDELFTQVKKAEANGFKCLKIKLGLRPIEEETKQLEELLQKISAETLIRLDANKSWTVKQSEWFLNTLAPYTKQIDGIEEPLEIFDKSDYQQLQKKTPIALALDESFSSTDSLNSFPVKRLILKPMAQGGLLKTLERVKQAQQLNIETIITSSIESGYGLWAISYLCAAINNQHYHGIATASWLEDTIIKPPEITHGIITL